MANQKIYILVTDTGTLFTRMIKFFTRKPYNHASIAFDRDLKEIYSFGRKNPNNPFIGGFVKENIKEGLFRDARCALYSLSVQEDEYQRMYHYIKKMEENKHLYKYNFMGLFWVLFNKGLDRKRAFFCSQFVASVLLKGKVVKFDKSTSLVRPHELLEIPDLEMVYEGYLSHYQSSELKKDRKPSRWYRTMFPV